MQLGRLLIACLVVAPSLRCTQTTALGGQEGEDWTDSGQDTSPCADAPAVTWETWGEGFVTESCQSCHASTSPDRNGAPEDVVFDTEADVLDRAATVLAVAAGDAPTMPPEGGVSDDDRALLEIWLTCSGG